MERDFVAEVVAEAQTNPDFAGKLDRAAKARARFRSLVKIRRFQGIPVEVVAARLGESVEWVQDFEAGEFDEAALDRYALAVTD